MIKRYADEVSLALNTHMNTLNREVDVIEQFIVVFDRHAGGKKYHYFLLSIFFQKSKKKHQSFLRGANHVTLRRKLDIALLGQRKQ